MYSRSAEALVQHAVQARDFLRVALDRERHDLRCVDTKIAGLPGHRAECGHLPEQPLQHVAATAGIRRQQPAGLLREIQHDRAGFEHRQRCAAAGRLVVDDRGNAIVRRQCAEFRRELVAAAQPQQHAAVGNARLFQKQLDLEPVGRRRVVQVDHGAAACRSRWTSIRATHSQFYGANFRSRDRPSAMPRSSRDP